MKYTYDVLVIGAGAGGLTVALWLTAAGKKVALVERGKIGGDCTNFGCIPSKALLDIAKTWKYSLLDWLEEMRRRRKEIQDEETPQKIAEHGLDFIQGSARFKDAHTLLVDNTTELSAKYIVLSTGSHASKLLIPGVDEKDVYTNTSIFELNTPIKKLVVVGGGYIGSELAEAFSNLWVQVTILQRGEYLVPREEKEASELLQRRFEKKGIQVVTRAHIVKWENGVLFVKDTSSVDTGISKQIPYDAILVALGREPNIADLGLETVGIAQNRWIIVDRYQRTQVKHIFAIGDCVDESPQFTHLANHQGRSVIRNILLPFFRTSPQGSALPMVLYADMEVARVGKTEEEILQNMSREDFRTEMKNFATNDRSKVTDDTEGFVKIHFARVTGKILGATIVGTKAGEMIPVLVSAMENGVSAYWLSKMMFAYPTKSEIIKKVCDQFVVHTLSHIRNEVRYLLKSNALQIATLSIWVSIFCGFLYFKSAYNLSNLDIAKQLYAFLTTSYWGSVIYIVVYAFRPIILFPATLLTFMSGALFGPLGGFIYTMIGENLSANFAYGIGRIFWKKIIPQGSKWLLSDLKVRFEKTSFLPVLLTRLLFLPFDLVNYGAGILKARWSGFFWWTLLGIIPGALVFILAGASIENAASFDFSQISFDTTLLLFSGGIFVFSLLLARLLRGNGK